MTADVMVANLVAELRDDQTQLGVLPYNWINLAQSWLDSLSFWQHLEAFPPYQLTTVAPYNIGTATFTQGSATVTGVGTTWTASMVNQVVQASGDYNYYWISAVPNATTLTLATTYAAPTVAASAYTVYTVSYSVPANMSLYKIKSLVLQNPHRRLTRIDEAEQDELAPNMLRVSAAPIRYTDWGQNQFQLFPVADKAYVVQIRYQQLPLDVSAAQLNFSWPPQMHPAIQKYAEALGWMWKDDDKAADTFQLATSLSQAHIDRNHVKTDYDARLRRFDEFSSFGKGGFVYPDRINFSGGVI